MEELERGHVRFEIRDITLVAVDTEVSPFPPIAQIIKCTRHHRSTKAGSLSPLRVVEITPAAWPFHHSSKLRTFALDSLATLISDLQRWDCG